MYKLIWQRAVASQMASAELERTTVEIEAAGEAGTYGLRTTGSVILFDYANGEVARYNFLNAWPSKITMGTLKAGSNEMLMEECSIVCEDLERV